METVEQAPVSRTKDEKSVRLPEAMAAAQLNEEEYRRRNRRVDVAKPSAEMIGSCAGLEQNGIAECSVFESAAEATHCSWDTPRHFLVPERRRNLADIPAQHSLPFGHGAGRILNLHRDDVSGHASLIAQSAALFHHRCYQV